MGLIGAGIQRSLSPVIHEEEARHHGLRVHYQLIDRDRTPGALQQLPTLLNASREFAFAGGFADVEAAVKWPSPLRPNGLPALRADRTLR